MAVNESDAEHADQADNVSESAASEDDSYEPPFDEHWEVNKSAVAALAARQANWRPGSKHELLDTLRQQYKQIKGLASLLHFWSSCGYFDRSIHFKALGLRDQDVYACGKYKIILRKKKGLWCGSPTRFPERLLPCPGKTSWKDHPSCFCAGL